MSCCNNMLPPWKPWVWAVLQWWAWSQVHWSSSLCIKSFRMHSALCQVWGSECYWYCLQSNQKLLEELPVLLRALGRMCTWPAHHLGHRCSCCRQWHWLLGSCSQSWAASMEKDTESESKENARCNCFQAFNRQVRKYLSAVLQQCSVCTFPCNLLWNI